MISLLKTVLPAGWGDHHCSRSVIGHQVFIAIISDAYADSKDEVRTEQNQSLRFASSTLPAPGPHLLQHDNVTVEPAVERSSSSLP